MSSLSDGDKPSSSVDSGPSTDQSLAQKIKALAEALEESVATQREFDKTITSQGAIIKKLKADVKTSEDEIQTLKAAVKTSEQKAETLNTTVEKLKAPRRPRNLVICIDGTSNQFGMKNTNVVELYHRLIRDENQLTFYNSGIGTYATPSWKSWRYWRLIIYNKIDLAIAWNFEGTIISAYRWLSENYEPGDKIFIFGFSRGAYQIRALAAMIDSVGLLRKGNLDQIPFAYELYAETKKTGPWTIVWIIKLVLGCVWTVIVILLGWGPLVFPVATRRPRLESETEVKHPDIKEMCKHFKETFSQKYVRIEFAGAWDTVSSVGFIRDKTLPGTTDGMEHVKFFRHALALHERRVKFLNENSRGGLGPTERAAGVQDYSRKIGLTDMHDDIGGRAESNLDVKETEKSDRLSIVWGINVMLRSVWTAIYGLLGWGHLFFYVVTQIALAPRKLNVELLNQNTSGGSEPRSTSSDSSVGRRTVRIDRPHTKEVWFAGSHGDIGGGAVANLTMNMFGPSLRWMLYEAVEAGLRITSTPETEKAAEVHDSLTWPWFFLEYLPITRLSYDDRDGLTSWPHRGQPRQIQPNQLIHSTALASPELWRAHLPGGVEWTESSLKDHGMVEEDRYADTRDLIARLSHLPPKNDDLYALKRLMERDDGKVSLQNTIGAEATLMALLQYRADANNLENHVDAVLYQGIHWDSESIASAALMVLNLDATERKQLEGEVYSVHQLLPLIDCAEKEKYYRLDRLKGLLAPDLIKKLVEIFKSSTDIPDASILHALEIVSKTDDWKYIQAIPGAETGFITLIQRLSTKNYLTGWGKQVIADVVLQLIQLERYWNDKYYSARALRPILVRARERNDLELLGRFEKRYAPAQVRLPFQHPNKVDCVAWMPDGARIVTGCKDNAVRVWDVKTGGIVGVVLTGHSDEVWSVAVSRDGSKIGSGSRDKTIRIRNAQTGAEISCLKGHMSGVTSLVISPDGVHIISGSLDKTIRVWDIASGKTVVGPIQGHEDAVWSVAYSPDGSRFASGSDDESIHVWNSTTGEELWQTKMPSEVYSVAYSPDGKQIVAGGEDEQLILDAETSAIVRRFEGDSRHAEFSPDGKKIVSASFDDTVQLWDAETGAELDVLSGHRNDVYSVAFSPNGKRIASASWDNTLRIWDATGAWWRPARGTRKQKQRWNIDG